MELRRTSCCGVRDFVGLVNYRVDNVQQVFQDMFNEWNAMNGAYIMFTMPNNTEMLDAITAFVVENELGSTHLMGPNYNPQSRRQLYVLMWQVHKANYERWGAAMLRAREEERRRAEQERQRLFQERVDAATARTDNRLLRRGNRVVVVANDILGVDLVGRAGTVTNFGPRDLERRVEVLFDNNESWWVSRDMVRREANT